MPGHPGPAAGAERRDAGALRTASPRVREMVARLAERFGRNAEAIDRTDGRSAGWCLLDRSSTSRRMLSLREVSRRDFHRLRAVLGADAAAADLLLHWREYFGLKRADETDRAILIAEIDPADPVAATGRGAVSRTPCR